MATTLRSTRATVDDSSARSLSIATTCLQLLQVGLPNCFDDLQGPAAHCMKYNKACSVSLIVVLVLYDRVTTRVSRNSFAHLSTQVHQPVLHACSSVFHVYLCLCESTSQHCVNNSKIFCVRVALGRVGSPLGARFQGNSAEQRRPCIEVHACRVQLSTVLQ